MKRDMDLVRHILITVRDSEKVLQHTAFFVDGSDWTEPVIIYHLKLLQAHGFIDGTALGAWGSGTIGYKVEGLTWDGQDFLEAMSDSKVWAKAKKVITDTVGSTTFSVIKETCNLVAMHMIKGAIGG